MPQYLDLADLGYKIWEPCRGGCFCSNQLAKAELHASSSEVWRLYPQMIRRWSLCSSNLAANRCLLRRCAIRLRLRVLWTLRLERILDQVVAPNENPRMLLSFQMGAIRDRRPRTWPVEIPRFLPRLLRSNTVRSEILVDTGARHRKSANWPVRNLDSRFQAQKERGK